MDWGWQGSVVSGNVVIDSDKACFEATHGPALIDHNIFFDADVEYASDGETATLTFIARSITAESPSRMTGSSQMSGR